MKRFLLFLMSIFLLSMALASPFTFRIPGIIKKEGVRINSLSTQLTIRLYKADSQTAHYEEKHDLNIKDGVFEVVIGAKKTIQLEDIYSTQNIYITLQTQGEEESPKYPLTSVPYSVFSKFSESAVKADYVGPNATINASQIIDSQLIANTANAVDWSGVINKPATYPSDWQTLINTPNLYPTDWSLINNKPLSYEIEKLELRIDSSGKSILSRLSNLDPNQSAGINQQYHLVDNGRNEVIAYELVVAKIDNTAGSLDSTLEQYLAKDGQRIKVSEISADGILKVKQISANLNANNITQGTIHNDRLNSDVTILGQTIENQEIADAQIDSRIIKDGSITNTDISPSASIKTSKMSGKVTDIAGHGLGVLATLNAVNADTIQNGSIKDIEIASDANIYTGKISGNIYQIKNSGLGILAAKNKISDQDWEGMALSIVHGGTNAITTFNARINLGADDASNLSKGIMNNDRLSSQVSLLGQTIESNEITSLLANKIIGTVATAQISLAVEWENVRNRPNTQEIITMNVVREVSGVMDAITYKNKSIVGQAGMSLGKTMLTDGGSESIKAYESQIKKNDNTAGQLTSYKEEYLAKQGSPTKVSTLTAEGELIVNKINAQLNANQLSEGIIPDARLDTNISRFGHTIESDEITNETIKSEDILNGTIINDDLAENSIYSSKIFNVNGIKIDNNSIADSKIITINGFKIVGEVALASTADYSLNSQLLNGNNKEFFLDASNLNTGILGDQRININVSRLGQSIDSLEIVNETIKSEDIENGTIQNEDIAGNTIASNKILNLNGSKIDDNSISDVKIIQVSGSKITGAVNQSISSNYAVNASLFNGEFPDFYRNADNINSGIIADQRISSNISRFGSSVESSEITDESIKSEDIQNGTIVNEDISENTISSSKIASLDGSKINSTSIPDSRIISISGSKVLSIVNQSNTANYVDWSGIQNKPQSQTLTTINVDNSGNQINESITVINSNVGINAGIETIRAEFSDGGNVNTVAYKEEIFKTDNTSLSMDGIKRTYLVNDGTISVVSTLNSQGLLETSGGFKGNGSLLTNLNANNLSFGIIPDARIDSSISRFGTEVESNEISNETIKSEDIQNGTITNEDIAENTIASSKVASISGTKINENSIADNKIISLNALKVSGIVGLAHTSNYSENSGLLDGQNSVYYVNASNLNAGTIADQRISDNISRFGSSVEGNEITDETIKSEDIQNGTIINEDLAENTISSSKIQSLDGSKINNLSISSSKINSIEGNKILPGINAGNITSGTLDNDRLKNTVSLLGQSIEAGEISERINSANEALTSVTANIAINAMSLNGQSPSFYTNADNINVGTIGNDRLSSEVSLLGNSIESSEISNETVKSEDIQNGTILNEDIADNTISSVKIVNISGAKIDDSSLPDNKIITLNALKVIGIVRLATTSNYSEDSNLLDGQNATYYLNASNMNDGIVPDERISSNISRFGLSVEGNEITDETIKSEDIQNGSITNEDLADNTINSSKIQNLDGTKINNLSVANDKIISIDGTKILSGINADNITSGKINDSRLNNTVSLLGQSIQASEINERVNSSNEALTAITSNIALNATNLNGQDSSFYTNATNLNAGTIGNARLSIAVSLLGQTIESNEIANETIKSEDILNGTIINEDIADNTIASSKIVSLDGSKIGSNSIPESKIISIIGSKVSSMVDHANTANYIDWSGIQNKPQSQTYTTVNIENSGNTTKESITLINNNIGSSAGIETTRVRLTDGGSESAIAYKEEIKKSDNTSLSMDGIRVTYLIKNGLIQKVATLNSDGLLELKSGFKGNGGLLTQLNANEVSIGILDNNRLNGNVSILGQSIESVEITDGTIQNSDLNANANIATSKLSGSVFLINGHGLGSLASLSEITSSQITNGTIQAMDIANGAITNEKIVTLDGTKVIGVTSAENSETLDNLDSSDFLRSNIDTQLSGQLNISHNPAGNVNTQGSLVLNNASAADTEYMIAGLKASSEKFSVKYDGALKAVSIEGNGSLITNLNGAEIKTGTVPDERLSNTVSKLGQSIESSEIAEGTIIDTDINSSAAIAWSKVSKSGAVPADIGAATDSHLHDDRYYTESEIGDNTSATNSGAFRTGLYDEFAYSNGINVQSVVNDLDDQIAVNATAISTKADSGHSHGYTNLGQSIESSEITDATITNADINANAGIDWTKVSKTGSNINDLANMNLSSLSNLDLIVYDITTGKWVNKNLPEAGIASSGHDHTGIYEPIFTKNNAFNKIFGSTSGTTAEGNDARFLTNVEKTGLVSGVDTSLHKHDDRYFTETELGLTASGSPGAGKIGMYGPFNNSSGTNIETVIKDIDTALTNHNHNATYFTETEIGDTDNTPGAELVGVYTSAINNSTATNVQDVLESFDVLLTNSLKRNVDESTSGQFKITKTPTGTGFQQGLLYLNPTNIGDTDTVFGYRESTTDRFKIAGNGDITSSGGANFSGSVIASSFSGSAVSLTNIPAGNLTGTIDNARLDADLQDLADGSLSGSKVGQGIVGDNITDGTIDSSEIEDNTIAAIDLAINSVGSEEIATNAVGTSEVADNSLTGTDIANNSLDFIDLENTLELDNTTEINLGLSNLNINLDNNGDFQILDNGVVNHIFYDNGNVRLGNGNEFCLDTNQNRIGILKSDPAYTLDINGSLSATTIYGNGANITSIAGDNITDGTIDSSEIEDNTLTTADLAINSVGSEEIVTGAVGTSEVEDNSLSGVDIANNTLDFADLENTLDVDSTTEINLGANNLNIDLDDSGDLQVMDAGVVQHVFYDNGDVKLGNNNEIFIDTDQNKIGILKNNPEEELDVEGDIKAKGNVYGELPLFYGNGSEGSYTSAGSFSLDGEHHYTDFTLQGGHMLTVGSNGWLVLRVNGTFTWSGYMDGNGKGSSGGTGGAYQSTNGTNGYPGSAGIDGKFLGGSGGGGGGGASRDGGTAGSGAVGGKVEGALQDATGGNAGAGGGPNSSGSNGSGGTAIDQAVGYYFALRSMVGLGAGGAGGGGGSPGNSSSDGGNGGNGGSGGGGVIIIANKIVTSGSPALYCNGADGNNGVNGWEGSWDTPGGGGGGGGGGVAIVLYRTLSGSQPSVSASGGTGGYGPYEDAGSYKAGNGANGGNGYSVSMPIN